MEISESSKQAITEFLTAWWNDMTFQVSQTVAGAGMPPMDSEQLYNQMFGQELQAMAAAAEGLLERTPVVADMILASVQSLCEWMWARPGMPAGYTIPAEWWGTPVGNLALRAHLWASGDELITLSQAAEISGKSLSSLSQMVDRGKITGYVDPGENNRTKRSRVMRSEIEALKGK